jgi:uncharacterized protein YjbJ (UPF0337 family)
MGEILDKLKGKAKRAEGELTGDRVRKAGGTLDEIKGDVKGGFERVKQYIKDAVHRKGAPELKR